VHPRAGNQAQRHLGTTSYFGGTLVEEPSSSSTIGAKLSCRPTEIASTLAPDVDGNDQLSPHCTRVPLGCRRDAGQSGPQPGARAQVPGTAVRTQASPTFAACTRPSIPV